MIFHIFDIFSSDLGFSNSYSKWASWWFIAQFLAWNAFRWQSTSKRATLSTFQEVFHDLLPPNGLPRCHFCLSLRFRRKCAWCVPDVLDVPDVCISHGKVFRAWRSSHSVSTCFFPSKNGQKWQILNWNEIFLKIVIFCEKCIKSDYFEIGHFSSPKWAKIAHFWLYKPLPALFPRKKSFTNIIWIFTKFSKIWKFRHFGAYAAAILQQSACRKRHFAEKR